jgi:hypothetical protein
MYKIYSSSMNLENSTSNKIQAIQIAKEWLEAMTNIRDTNWLLFSSDYKNCWNTYNYDTGCVSNISPNLIAHNGHYIVYQDTDSRWKLFSPSWVSIYNFGDTNYQNAFKIWLDANGFYTNTWVTTNLYPIFTREIRVHYIDTSDPTNGPDSWDEKMEVRSIVQWVDPSANVPHKVELKTILSNWKG